MTAATAPEHRPAMNGDLDNGSSYEIIDGLIKELPPMSIFAQRLTTVLTTRLELFGETSKRGQAIMEGLFHLPLPLDRNRRPDIAFILAQRWPLNRPLPARDNAWDLAPDLAVEVVSPTDYLDELFTKLDEYFRAGVRQVWVVFPLLGYVQVYDSLTQCHGLLRQDTLDGGTLLPGFSLPLAQLFPDPSASA
jgi:Uma2 family endonuclease